MNEEIKRRGRPPKSHLQDEHHYQSAVRTEDVLAAYEIFQASDDAVAAGAPPAAAESDQADASDEALSSDSASAEPIEAIVENPTLPMNAISTESPVEEKIHELVAGQVNFNGWHPILESDMVINLPPRNGNPVRLSETPDSEGVIAFWKRERAFANATKRWQEHGVWRDFYTGMKIDFEPKYWKDRF